MNIRIAVHSWFERGAGWAFHPDITPEVRRRLVADLGRETSGTAGPVGPVQLAGRPPYLVVGVRTENPDRTPGERRKPVLRLALVPGRLDDEEGLASIRAMMCALRPEEAGLDASLTLEWDGPLTPLTTPTGSPRPPGRRWGRWVALAAVVLAAVGAAGVGYQRFSPWGRPQDSKEAREATAVPDQPTPGAGKSEPGGPPQPGPARVPVDPAVAYWNQFREEIRKALPDDESVRKNSGADLYERVEAVYGDWDGALKQFRQLGAGSDDDAFFARLKHERERSKYETAGKIIEARRHEEAKKFLERWGEGLRSWEGTAPPSYVKYLNHLRNENTRLQRLAELVVVDDFKDNRGGASRSDREMRNWFPEGTKDDLKEEERETWMTVAPPVGGGGQPRSYPLDRVILCFRITDAAALRDLLDGRRTFSISVNDSKGRCLLRSKGAQTWRPDGRGKVAISLGPDKRAGGGWAVITLAEPKNNQPEKDEFPELPPKGPK